jgi:putative transposase
MNHVDVPRKPRVDSPGAIHHVIAKGIAGEPIAADEVDREALVKRIGETVQRHRWSCLAYCILDTHFHLIVATPSPNLGVGMQWLLAPYSRSFNRRHERQGNLFHSRFYSARVTSEEHLTAAIVYVVLNPVRAGIVQQPELWNWSSYSATVGLAPAPAFLDTTATLELLGPDPRTARLRFQVAVLETRDRDRGRTGV